MPRYICKLEHQGTPYYFEWSTIVDAPVTYGMSLDEFKEYYQSEYGRAGIDGLAERLERVKATGTSSRVHDSVHEVIDFNRAGQKETCLTEEQIIDYYCVRQGQENGVDVEAPLGRDLNEENDDEV